MFHREHNIFVLKKTSTTIQQLSFDLSWFRVSSPPYGMRSLVSRAPLVFYVPRFFISHRVSLYTLVRTKKNLYHRRRYRTKSENQQRPDDTRVCNCSRDVQHYITVRDRTVIKRRYRRPRVGCEKRRRNVHKIWRRRSDDVKFEI